MRIGVRCSVASFRSACHASSKILAAGCEQGTLEVNRLSESGAMGMRGRSKQQGELIDDIILDSGGCRFVNTARLSEDHVLKSPEIAPTSTRKAGTSQSLRNPARGVAVNRHGARPEPGKQHEMA
mmetsp:Transcript_50405/g.127002  ORF Transcript_50405/g.127002 Transcript_50405/m.127002 type:complete len:125 (-) Transcript_50405:3-377(-)